MAKLHKFVTISCYDGETGVGVAASEDDIIRDQNERSNLQRVIASAESAMADSAPGAGTRRVLENLVEQARKRIAVLEKKIEESTRERETAAAAQVAMAARLAEKEARLSEEEKKTYSGFLAKEFFTKKDFGKLENFYAHAWDRLSEGGKEEMSHRVWEGIRRDEYRFTDLPQVVQEKEAKRLYTKLTSPSIEQGHLNQIPEVDRTDFLRAYEAGNQKETRQILNRESFRRNVSLETSNGVGHKIADAGKKLEDGAIGSTVTSASKKDVNPEMKSTAAEQFGDLALDSLNLKGAKLVDSSSPPSAASIPDASGSHANARS